MKRLNKKGFTLVELLAVIVVLAIIMIIAIPSVMDSMNKGKKSSFKMYAQKMLTAAQTKYQTDVLTGTSLGNCYYGIDKLSKSTGNYKGYIDVDTTSTSSGCTTDNPCFKIYLTDNSYSISGATYNDLDNQGASGVVAIGNASSSITNTPSSGTACS